MDINSIQGANAYANTRPVAESNVVQEQNQEAAQTDLNQESTRAVQEAFEVNITQEAREAAAGETEETQLPEPAQAAAAEQTPAQQPSQIVNIVA
jgi:hypothetical protein